MLKPEFDSKISEKEAEVVKKGRSLRCFTFLNVMPDLDTASPAITTR
jgi:hypothetical protein